MHATMIVGWKYDADLHCPGCAAKAWGESLYTDGPPSLDSEGNEVTPVFADEVTEDDVCGDCFGPLL